MKIKQQNLHLDVSALRFHVSLRILVNVASSLRLAILLYDLGRLSFPRLLRKKKVI